MKRFTLLIGMALLQTIFVQPPFPCSGNYTFTISYPVIDNRGIAPRPVSGTEDLFNCIADNDPNFANRRFPDEEQAQHYWFNLVLQELGLIQQPQPPSFFEDPWQALNYWLGHYQQELDLPLHIQTAQHSILDDLFTRVRRSNTAT